MYKSILLLSALGLSCGCESSDPIEKTVLPSRFVENRVFVAPITTAGDTLLFYTDTGGGSNLIWREVVDSLGLQTEWQKMGADSVRVLSFPECQSHAAIPPPTDLPPFGENLLVTKPPESPFHGVGLLGRTWFADRVWEFDYLEQELALIDSGYASHPHRAALGFQTDSTGRRTTHFPRIEVVVAEDTLDLLFDTGATVFLSENARAELNETGPSKRGTSFITESVFDRWRENHPQWRVIEQGDRFMNTPMIEVPEITLAGYIVGPVWFTVRPDKNFHEYMSQWMDKQVDGALGGSALQYFRVIVDYPNAQAVFWTH